MHLKDDTLIIISLSTSLIGILILLFLSQQISPISIKEAHSLSENTRVSLNTTIIHSKIWKNKTILTLEDSCSIIGVFDKALVLEPQTKVSLKGRIHSFKDEKEILIDEIILLDD